MKFNEPMNIEANYSVRSKYISSFFLSFCISLIVALIVFFIFKIFDNALLADIMNGESNIAGIEYARPESRELYSYAVFFVLFIFCFILFCTLLENKLQKLFVYTDTLLKRNTKIYLACFICIFISLALFSHYFFDWYGFIFFALVLLGLFLFFILRKKEHLLNKVTLLKNTFEKPLKIGTYVLCGLLFVFVLFFYYCTNYFNSFGAYHHFSAYYYSIFDVYNGGTLLIDTNSIYGFYAYFLMPYFKLFGLSFVSFTILMLIMTAIIMLCVFYILNTITKNYWLIFLGFFAFVGYMFFYGIGHDGFLYLQYLPHRVLTPVVMLAYVCRISKKNRLNLFNIIIGYVLSSLFLLWNMETGVISLIAFCLFVIFMKVKKYDKICKGLILDVVKFLFLGAIAASSSIVFILVFTMIKSGTIINVFSLFNLVGQGYFMLPLPPRPHLFMVLIFGYTMALAISIFQQKVLSKKSDMNPTSPILFAMSIIGILSFIYYLGRSHDFNLVPCTWTSIFLVIYFLDYAQKRGAIKHMQGIDKQQNDGIEQEAASAKEARVSCKNHIIQKTENYRSCLLPLIKGILICVMLLFAVFTVSIPTTNTLTKDYIRSKTSTSIEFVQNKDFIKTAFADKDSLFLVSQNSAMYLTDIKKEQKFKYKSSCDWITIQDYENALLLLSEIDEDFIMAYDIQEKLNKYFPERQQSILEKFDVKAQTNNEYEILIFYTVK